uniref:SHC SH2 domain-binding protein 1 n=1 Tax=Myxine glutinosa TaxID=7769 RepID=UPI00358F9DF1
GNIAGEAGNIAGEAGNIAGEAGNIAGEAGNIAGEAGNIAGEAGNIAGEAGNIAGEAGNIAGEAVDNTSHNNADADECNSDCNKPAPPRAHLSKITSGSDIDAFPDIFMTNHLSYYVRFKAYQDYILGDCKTCEIYSFIADYLEEMLEPEGWQAIWVAEGSSLLIDVCGLSENSLEVYGRPSVPHLYSASAEPPARMAMLLEQGKAYIPIQQLWVVYDERGRFERASLALEHIRFFSNNIWRDWDIEDDDDYDYFVRSAGPRLRLHYDILEGRLPSGLVSEYSRLLKECRDKYSQFVALKRKLQDAESNDGVEEMEDPEPDPVSMVEGVHLDNEIKALKQKLKILEDPMLRYVLGYQTSSGQAVVCAKGPREDRETLTHIVSEDPINVHTMTALLEMLHQRGHDWSLLFHRDVHSALDACYEGDTVLLCPGRYVEDASLSIAESIQFEGFGLPDDVVIEKSGRGDIFVQCSADAIYMSNIKFVQHDTVEGILVVLRGQTVLHNCVLHCETTGVTVRTNAHLRMENCDLYGAKCSGLELYPGSACDLAGNNIHHCKEGILIKDFMASMYDMPKLNMTNNRLHSNELYGVTLVKPQHLEAKLEPGNQEMVEQKPNEVEGLHNSAMENSNDVGRATHEEYISLETEKAITAEILSASHLKHKENVVQEKHNDASCEAIVEEQDAGKLPEDMFIFLSGNSFRRNGKGAFGIFYY